MSDNLQFYRGPKTGMPSLLPGEPGWVTDEKRLYVGNESGGNTSIPNMDDLNGVGSFYVTVSGTSGSYTSDRGAQEVYEAFQSGKGVFVTIGANVIPLTHVTLSGSTYSAQFNVFSGVEGYQSILLTQSDATQHVYVLENKIAAEDVSYDGTTSGLSATDVKSAIDELKSEKQDSITGTQGQIVGFDENGKPVAQNAPATGVTTFNGRTGAVTPENGDYTADMVGARASTWVPTAAEVGAIPSTEKGAPSGVAELDSTGHVPANQLPSYVDDVIEAYVVGSTPYSQDWLSAESGGTALTPEANKIYLVVSPGDYENKQYRWAGTQYAVISDSIALGETASTAYYGDKGKTAYDHSQLTSGNPHNVTKSDIGLGNVDNTSDEDKPISTAQQTALDTKQNVLTGTAGQIIKIGSDGNAAAENDESISIEGGATATPPTGLTGPYEFIFTDEEDLDVSADEIAYDNLSSQLSAETVQAAIDELKTEKQEKIVGEQGKIVGFDSSGNAVPQDPPSGALSFGPQNVEVSSWATDTTYSDAGYGFRASVTLSGVTENHIPNVTFSLADSISNNFAPVAESYNGGIYIYAKETPSATMQIASIFCIEN